MQPTSGYLFFYPATLVNLFTSSNSLLVESLGFSIYSIMSVYKTANNDSFPSSLPIWMPFIYSCVIAAARTFSSMLSKSGEHGNPCLVPLNEFLNSVHSSHFAITLVLVTVIS